MSALRDFLVRQAPPDAVAQAQQQAPVPAKRPEQTKTPHDLSAVFGAQQAQPASPVFQGQPKDTVEFFNIVLQLKLTAAEKGDLVAFLRQL
jgi:hypothetical protein